MAIEYIPVEDYVFISLSEAKKQLRLDDSFTVEDSKLQGDIDGAQGAAEQYTERTIVNETLNITLDVFDSVVAFNDWRPINKPNIEVSVIPLGETEYEVVDADQYSLTKYCGSYLVRFKEDIAVADITAAVKIVVACNVPAVVKSACLLKVSEFYEIRENRPVTGREAFEKLLFPFRKFD